MGMAIPGQLSPSAAPAPQGAVAGAAPEESQNTSQFLSILARTLGLGHAWTNPYSDPAGTIVQNAIAGPSPDDGQRVRGMPQSYPKGAPPLSAPMSTAMGGGLGPAPTSAPRPAPMPQTAPPPVLAPGTGAPPGPGVPPPSVPEDASQNVAMGTGPGTARTLSHEEAAGLGGAAAAAGHAVANDPSVTSQIIKQLSTQGLANDPQSAWLALAQAGFSMAASHNPSVLGAMGEGAVAGLQGYQQSRAQRAQQLYTAGELQNRSDLTKQQGKYQDASVANEKQRNVLEAQRLAQADKQYADMLPTELALKKAETGFYEDRGTAALARASGTGGSGRGAGHEPVALQIAHALMAADSSLTLDQALAKSKGGNPALSLAKVIYANKFDGSPFADSYAEAEKQLGQIQGGGAGAPAPTAPAAAPAAAAGSPAPVGKAPGVADGALGGGGTLKAKGGLWYPIQ